MDGEVKEGEKRKKGKQAEDKNVGSGRVKIDAPGLRLGGDIVVVANGILISAPQATIRGSIIALAEAFEKIKDSSLNPQQKMELYLQRMSNVETVFLQALKRMDVTVEKAISKVEEAQKQLEKPREFYDEDKIKELLEQTEQCYEKATSPFEGIKDALMRQLEVPQSSNSDEYANFDARDIFMIGTGHTLKIKKILTPKPPTYDSPEELAGLKAAIIRRYEQTAQKVKVFPENREISVKDYYTELALVKETEKKQDGKQESSSEQDESIQTHNVLHSEDNTFLGKTIGLESLFDLSTCEDKEKPLERQIIIGSAGIGKTTLCQRIVYLLILAPEEERIWHAQGFELPIWLPLRALQNNVSENLAEAVHANCLLQADRDIYPVAAIQAFLTHYGDKLLFLLDGYDEIADSVEKAKKEAAESKKACYLELILEDCSQRKHWIITSRPNAIYSSPFYHKKSCLLENIGFNTEQILRFINNYFEAKYKDKLNAEVRASIERLKNLVVQSMKLAGAARIPINLQLICYLYSEASDDKTMLQALATMTLTELYTALNAKLAIRYLNSKHHNPRYSEYKDLNTRLPESILSDSQIEPALAFLEEIACWGMEHNQNEFSFAENQNQELFKIYQEAKYEFKKRTQLDKLTLHQLHLAKSWLTGSTTNTARTEKAIKLLETLGKKHPGIIRKEVQILIGNIKDEALQDALELLQAEIEETPSASPLKQPQVDFRRLLTERLGMLAVIGQSNEAIGNKYTFHHRSFQEYFAARHFVSCFIGQRGIKQQEWAEEFFRDHKYHQYYQYVWWFVVGLLKDKQENLNRLFNIFFQAPRDLIGDYEALFLTRCLEEGKLLEKIDKKYQEVIWHAVLDILWRSLTSKDPNFTWLVPNVYSSLMHALSQSPLVIQNERIENLVLNILLHGNSEKIWNSVEENLVNLLSNMFQYCRPDFLKKAVFPQLISVLNNTQEKNIRLLILELLSRDVNIIAKEKINVVIKEVKTFLKDRESIVQSRAIRLLEKYSNLLRKEECFNDVVDNLIKILLNPITNPQDLYYAAEYLARCTAYLSKDHLQQFVDILYLWSEFKQPRNTFINDVRPGFKKYIAIKFLVQGFYDFKQNGVNIDIRKILALSARNVKKPNIIFTQEDVNIQTRIDALLLEYGNRNVESFINLFKEVSQSDNMDDVTKRDRLFEVIFKNFDNFNAENQLILINGVKEILNNHDKRCRFSITKLFFREKANLPKKLDELFERSLLTFLSSDNDNRYQWEVCNVLLSYYSVLPEEVKNTLMDSLFNLFSCNELQTNTHNQYLYASSLLHYFDFLSDKIKLELKSLLQSLLSVNDDLFDKLTAELIDRHFDKVKNDKELINAFKYFLLGTLRNDGFYQQIDAAQLLIKHFYELIENEKEQLKEILQKALNDSKDENVKLRAGELLAEYPSKTKNEIDDLLMRLNELLMTCYNSEGEIICEKYHFSLSVIETLINIAKQEQKMNYIENFSIVTKGLLFCNDDNIRYRISKLLLDNHIFLTDEMISDIVNCLFEFLTKNNGKNKIHFNEVCGKCLEKISVEILFSNILLRLEYDNDDDIVSIYLRVLAQISEKLYEFNAEQEQKLLKLLEHSNAEIQLSALKLLIVYSKSIEDNIYYKALTVLLKRNETGIHEQTVSILNQFAEKIPRVIKLFNEDFLPNAEEKIKTDFIRALLSPPVGEFVSIAKMVRFYSLLSVSKYRKSFLQLARQEGLVVFCSQNNSQYHLHYGRHAFEMQTLDVNLINATPLFKYQKQLVNLEKEHELDKFEIAECFYPHKPSSSNNQVPSNDDKAKHFRQTLQIYQRVISDEFSHYPNHVAYRKACEELLLSNQRDAVTLDTMRSSKAITFLNAGTISSAVNEIIQARSSSSPAAFVQQNGGKG